MECILNDRVIIIIITVTIITVINTNYSIELLLNEKLIAELEELRLRQSSKKGFQSYFLENLLKLLNFTKFSKNVVNFSIL